MPRLSPDARQCKSLLKSFEKSICYRSNECVIRTSFTKNSQADVISSEAARRLNHFSDK